MAVVSELVTKFKFDGSINPLNNFNKGLNLSVVKMVTFVGAITAVGVAFGKMVHNTLSEADALVQLSKTTGVAINDIQSLSFAASVSGSSIKAMEGSIASLSKKIGEASLNGSSEFQRIGVAVRTSTGEIRKADDVLLDIADRFKALNLTMSQQQSLASSLGIDASLVQLLSKSTDEIDRLRGRAEKFGLLSKKNANQIANYNDGMAELRFRFLAFKQAISIQVLPTVFKLWEGLDILGVGISRVGNFFIDFIKENKGLALLLGVITSAFIAINTPIVAITIGIGALLTIFDDLIVAFKGGDSIIKKWVAPFFDLEKVLKKIVQYYKAIGELRSKAFGVVKDKYFGSVKNLFSQDPKGRETNNNLEQNTTININSNSPEAVGNSVENIYQKQLDKTKAEFSRGGI